MGKTGSPRVTNDSFPNIHCDLCMYLPHPHRPDVTVGWWVDTVFMQRLLFASRSFSPFLTELDLSFCYALPTKKRSGFKPLRIMRCRAHLFVSTRLENVFTAV